MERNEQVLNLLMKTGLNWTVNKEPLQSVDGKPTNSFGLFRNDSGLHLGTVGKQYKVYDNYELAEAIVDATAEIGLSITRGGLLNQGRKVYLQAELEDSFVGRTVLRRWITGLNAHDATRQIGFGSSNTAVICENTYHMAYGDLAHFRHTASAVERITEFVKGMRKAMGFEEELIQKYKIMADLPIRDEIIARVMKSTFDVDLDMKQGEVSTQQKAKIEKVVQALQTSIVEEGNTLWALFNGVTRYTNHVATVKDGKRNDYLMVGEGYKTNLTGFNEIMAWVEANTELEPVLVEM